MVVALRPATRVVRWLPDSGPRTIAGLRIATGAASVLELSRIGGFTIPPPGLWFPPAGTAWLSFLPVSQTLYVAAVALGVLAATALAIGWRPRWSASIAATALFYAGWVTTLTGKVDHSHHIIWVLALLAVSPCANIWAVRREDRVGSYQWPAFAVIVLIGLIYFGAGVQKIASAGLTWGWSDNLANTMLNMAWENNQPVHQWLIDWPLLGRVMGLAGLAFELTFLLLILIPQTRRWVWPAGLIFHLGTWAILGISFITLQVMYVVFLPLDQSSVESKATDAQRRLTIGLVAAVAVFSLLGIDRAWPVAAYPGFEGIKDHYVTDVEATIDEEKIFVTDSEAARQVGSQRILLLVWSTTSTDRFEDLAAWLGADRLDRVVVDTSTGLIVDRRGLYRG